MAGIATVLTEVQLEAQKAIASWNQFGKVGVEQLRAVGRAANETNATLGKVGAGAGKGLEGFTSGLQGTLAKVQGFGAKMSIALTVPLVALGREAVKGWREQEAVLAQLDAAIKSTGGTVGVSREEMVSFAEETQKSFAFADDEIEHMQVNLLKFQSVTKDTFRRAQSVIMDFATRTGQDLPAAANIIGRAR
jgi:hypothetical protein